MHPQSMLSAKIRTKIHVQNIQLLNFNSLYGRLTVIHTLDFRFVGYSKDM